MHANKEVEKEIKKVRLFDELLLIGGRNKLIFKAPDDEKHFDAQFHAQLTGTSGVQHPSDIVAKRKGVLLVADVSLTGNKNDAVSSSGRRWM